MQYLDNSSMEGIGASCLGPQKRAFENGSELLNHLLQRCDNRGDGNSQGLNMQHSVQSSNMGTITGDCLPSRPSTPCSQTLSLLAAASHCPPEMLQKAIGDVSVPVRRMMFLRNLYAHLVGQNPSYASVPFPDFCEGFLQRTGQSGIQSTQLDNAQQMQSGHLRQLPLLLPKVPLTNNQTYQQLAANPVLTYPLVSGGLTEVSSIVNTVTPDHSTITSNVSDDRSMMEQWYQANHQDMFCTMQKSPAASTVNTSSVISEATVPLPPPPPLRRLGNPNFPQCSDSNLTRPYGGTPHGMTSPGSVIDCSNNQITNTCNTSEPSPSARSSFSPELSNNNLTYYRIESGKQYRVDRQSLNAHISHGNPFSTTGENYASVEGIPSDQHSNIQGVRILASGINPGSACSRSSGIDASTQSIVSPRKRRGRQRKRPGDNKEGSTNLTKKPRGRRRRMDASKNEEEVNEPNSSDPYGRTEPSKDGPANPGSTDGVVTKKRGRRKNNPGVVKFNFNSKASRTASEVTAMGSEEERLLRFSQNERIAIGERVKKLLHLSRLTYIKKEKTEESACESEQNDFDETLPQIKCSKRRKRQREIQNEEPQHSLSTGTEPEVVIENIEAEEHLPADGITQWAEGETTFSNSGCDLQDPSSASCNQLPQPCAAQDGYDSDATIPYMEESDQEIDFMDAPDNVNETTDPDRDGFCGQGQEERTAEISVKQEDCETIVQVSCIPEDFVDSKENEANASVSDNSSHIGETSISKDKTEDNILVGGVLKVMDHPYRYLEMDGTRFIPFQDLNKIFDQEDIKYCLKSRRDGEKGKFSAIRCSDVEVKFFNKLEQSLPVLQENSLLLEEDLLLTLLNAGDQTKINNCIDSSSTRQSPISNSTKDDTTPVNTDSSCEHGTVDIKAEDENIVTPCNEKIIDTPCRERDDETDTISVSGDEIMQIDDDDILPVELSLNEGVDENYDELVTEVAPAEETDKQILDSVKIEINEDFEADREVEDEEKSSEDISPVIATPGENVSENDQPAVDVANQADDKISVLIMKALTDYDCDEGLEKQLPKLSCQCQESCQESHLLMTKAFLTVWKQNSVLKDQISELRSDVEKLKDEYSTSQKLHKAALDELQRTKLAVVERQKSKS